ncbi:hypothetical protein Ddye_014631 [Dipteronia dyeriana]|uniref:RNase H type-1 domain-containing protein n=1 Tax=Dipteronia dyeriana TaxID=168575 RepID=A0AAE0CKQ6_9ROSI|nr:hypothetical protein Ddye_014631 [Dipteronia dyeriana]
MKPTTPTNSTSSDLSDPTISGIDEHRRRLVAFTIDRGRIDLHRDKEEDCVSEHYKDTVKLKKRRVQAWIPPGMEALNFNVDGSARGQPGSARIGGVLRDCTGMALCLFSLVVSCQDSIAPELMAIEKACSLCVLNPVLKGSVIKTVNDSMMVVSWINGDSFGNLRH